MDLQNANPEVHQKYELTKKEQEMRKKEELDWDVTDKVDSLEVFDIIRNIYDPEHPLTLEELNVVSLSDTVVNGKWIDVYFTPTIPNCSSASLIGLIIYIKLKECLPFGYKFKVFIKPGSHDLELSVNKQLADKERVSAAFENAGLRNSIREKLVPEQSIQKLIASM